MPPFKSKSGDADFDRVFNGEEGMRQQLLDELMQISEEESKYKAGQAAIEEQLYSEASIQEIDRQKLLRRKTDYCKTSQQICGISVAPA